VALNLATRWRAAGHEVTIVLGRSGGNRPCSAPALDYWSIPTKLSTSYSCLATLMLSLLPR
jgi:hypothetical protein